MPHHDSRVFREEFEAFLREIGVWAIYTRTDRRFRCQACYDLTTHDAAADCENCFGTGFKVQLQRWFVYHSPEFFRASPAQTPVTRVGITNEGPRFVFTRAADVPVKGDRFFIVEWDTDRDTMLERGGGQPVSIVHVLQVDHNEPNIAGQVIYNTAHCRYVTEGLHQYERALFATPVTVTRFP